MDRFMEQNGTDFMDTAGIDRDLPLLLVTIPGLVF